MSAYGSRAKYIFAVVFILLAGAGLLIGATVLKNKTEEKLRTWTSVNAVVVDYEVYVTEDEDGREKYSYYRIAEYVVNGKKYRVTESESQILPPTLGNSVTVYYNPHAPGESMFGAPSHIIYIILYAVGGVAVVSGIALAVLAVKRR